VAHEFLVPVPERQRGWLWWLILLSLHVLNSDGEILDQLHLRFK
jgi:exosome complex RNA-binding protein Rrp42 (RNase PH superfamily)